MATAALHKAPEGVRIGSLILGRGSVYEYPTRHYLDRERQPGGACVSSVTACFPCLEGRLCTTEPMVESHPGAFIKLKDYSEEIGQTIYDNRYGPGCIDGLQSYFLWRYMSSGMVLWTILLLTFLIGCLKCLHHSMEEEHAAVLTATETLLAFYCLAVRTLQTLTFYWRERALRHNLEVTAWDDGTVTRGRPLSLFMFVWLYLTIQIATLCSVVFGSLSVTVNGRPHYSVLTTTLPLFLVSEPLSANVQRRLEVWCGDIMQDHMRLALIESRDIFDEAWHKLKDFQTQNRIHTFKEAMVKSFSLDRYRLTYMIK